MQRQRGRVTSVQTGRFIVNRLQPESITVCRAFRTGHLISVRLSWAPMGAYSYREVKIPPIRSSMHACFNSAPSARFSAHTARRPRARYGKWVNSRNPSLRSITSGTGYSPISTPWRGWSRMEITRSCGDSRWTSPLTKRRIQSTISLCSALR